MPPLGAQDTRRAKARGQSRDLPAEFQEELVQGLVLVQLPGDDGALGPRVGGQTDQHKCAQAAGWGGHCPSAWPYPTLTPDPTLTPGPLPVCSSCLPPVSPVPHPARSPHKPASVSFQAGAELETGGFLSTHSWEFAQTLEYRCMCM